MQKEMFGSDELHPAQMHHRATPSSLAPSKEQRYQCDKLGLFLKTSEQHFNCWTDSFTFTVQRSS